MVWALAVVSVRGSIRTPWDCGGSGRSCCVGCSAPSDRNSLSIRTPWGGGELGEVAAMAEALPVIAILRFFELGGSVAS